jgi:hypothetical protein
MDECTRQKLSGTIPVLDLGPVSMKGKTAEISVFAVPVDGN